MLTLLQFVWTHDVFTYTCASDPRAQTPEMSTMGPYTMRYKRSVHRVAGGSVSGSCCVNICQNKLLHLSWQVGRAWWLDSFLADACRCHMTSSNMAPACLRFCNLFEHNISWYARSLKVRARKESPQHHLVSSWYGNVGDGYRFVVEVQHPQQENQVHWGSLGWIIASRTLTASYSIWPIAAFFNTGQDFGKGFRLK